MHTGRLEKKLRTFASFLLQFANVQLVAIGSNQADKGKVFA